MKVLHDLVAVRGEFCFAAVGWAVVCVTGVSREGLSRVLMLKSEDLPVDGYCSATRNWLVRWNWCCSFCRWCGKGHAVSWNMHREVCLNRAPGVFLSCLLLRLCRSFFVHRFVGAGSDVMV